MISRLEHLGFVECPSGILVLLDLGLVHHWERRGILPRDREVLTDLAIEGRDAHDAGLRYDRSFDPLALFDVLDVPAAQEHFASFAAEHGFDASAVPMREQVPHATRAQRALSAREPGIGCVVYDSLWGIVAEVPRDRPLEVVGVPMPRGEFEGRFRSIDVVVQPNVDVASSRRVDGIMVDHGQFLCIDLDVLDAFEAQRSLDGLFNFAFWGADAPALAAELGAAALDERSFGWRDRPREVVRELVTAVERAKSERGLRFAMELRPHSHREQIDRQVRAQASRAGQIELAGRKLCGFDNRWGDGLFPVYRDDDASGALVRVRIDVGNDRTQRNMRRIAHQWQRVLITRAVLEGGEPPRFVDRDEPMRPDDSGWTITSGTEPKDDPGFVTLPVNELVARFPELDVLLDEAVGARFTWKRNGEYARES